MLRAGDEIELAVEKPAAGGRMLARQDGRVVFVHGAIPGERVRARVERVERQLAFATTTSIVEPSPDRRTPVTNLRCGGCSYAHIAYQRQLLLKAEVIHEAFLRVGRIVLDERVAVNPSPERGYRMRARFHVRSNRVGFYREGTHDLCDASTTGQLLENSVSAATAAVLAAAALTSIVAAELSENIAADQRVLHLEAPAGQAVSTAVLEAAVASVPAGALTGCTTSSAGHLAGIGTPIVADPLSQLTGGRVGSGILRRHAVSFFQANRYLVPELVSAVLDAVPPGGSVLDLYAGVGLFSVSLARSGGDRITAVEGDRASARDLTDNAALCGAALRVVVGSVEDYLVTRPNTPVDTIIVDPPRSGISRAATEAIVERHAARVVYVSCDPPTMGRDARRLLDGGYRLVSMRAFDLFPNTPHVETVGVFDRVSS